MANIKDKKPQDTAYVGKTRKTKHKISWGADSRIPTIAFGANQQAITTNFGILILKGTAVYLVPTINVECNLDNKIAQFKLKDSKYTYRLTQSIKSEAVDTIVKALDKLALKNKAYILDNLEQLHFDSNKKQRKRKSHYKKLNRQVLEL